MGVGTWLNRYERSGFERAATAASARPLWDRLSDNRPAERAVLGHIETLSLHRTWHALHVALTGAEQGGLPPACYVIWTTLGAVGASMSAASFIHASETVREVADLLGTRNTTELIHELRAACELGMYVYTFEYGDGVSDLITSGEFERSFRELARFYAAAAAADQVVTVLRA